MSQQFPPENLSQMLERLGGVNAFTAPKPMNGCPLPIQEMHLALRSLRRKKYSIVGAESGGAKSALLGQICEMTACSGRNAILFSAEMASEDVWQRLMLGRAQVDSYDFEAGGCTKQQMVEVHRAITDLAALKNRLLIVEDPGITPNGMRSILDALALQGWHPDLIGVDYLQFIQPDVRCDTERQAVTLVSQELNKLKKEYNTHVMVLTQLTPRAEDPEPTKYWIRESKSPMNDADHIILFWHKNGDENTVHSKRLQWKIDKNRGGRHAKGVMYFIPAFTRFHRDWDPPKRLEMIAGTRA